MRAFRWLHRVELRRFFISIFILFALPSAAFASLFLSDPLGDTVGDGSLAAPTAERFNTALFDVRSLSVLEGDTFAFNLELAALAPRSFGGETDANAGFQPIIEVYLDSEKGGAQTLLPGSGMQLNGAWDAAFQIAGGRLRVFSPDAAGNPIDVTASLGARLTQTGDTLTVMTNLTMPQRFSLYGVAGSYDPFSVSGWRSVTQTPSPWHFSSPNQTRPVIDVMADDPALQARAIQSGVLPEIRTSFQQRRWLFVAAAGALVALLGFALRLFVPAPPAATPKPKVVREKPTVPIISYGAREAGERAQILRSIDFETLQRGGWLEPIDEPEITLGDVKNTARGQPDVAVYSNESEARERLREFGD